MRLVITTPFLETCGGMERVILKIAQHFDAKIHCMYYNADATFQEFRKLDVEVAKPTLLSKLPIGKRAATAVDVGNYFYNLKLDTREYDVINAQQTPSEWIRNKNSPVIWYCLHEDTPIIRITKKTGLTYSSIKELRTGDRLYSFTDKMNAIAVKVLKIKKRCTSNLRIVRLKNGRELTTTPEHKFFVIDPTGNLVVKETQELQPTDRLPIPAVLPAVRQPQKTLNVKKILAEKFGDHPYWKNRLFVSFDNKKIAIGNRKVLTIPTTIKITEELMRFLGYYISEGYIYFRHSEKREDMQLGMSFGIHEDKLVRDAICCIRKSLRLEPKIKRVPNRSEIIVILPNIAALLVLALGCGTKARNKRVPDLIFRCKRELQKAFLMAYLAGDGHFYSESKKWRAVTVSRNLVNSLLYLFSFIGCQGGIIRRRAHKFNNYLDRMGHQIYALDIPLERKRYEKRGDLLLVPIREILSLRQSNSVVYDIEVAGNHSFLAGDCIYTHNCHTPNREAFDLYQWRMQRRSLPSKAVFWASIQAFKHIEFGIVPRVEYLFTNSRNSQGRIKKYLGRESEILYPGVEYEKFSCRGYENFFLYPARIVPEKELEYAIQAFKIFSKKIRGWRLVIAGSLSSRPEHIAYYKRILAMCATMDSESVGSIVLETNVSDEHLLDLYSRCRAVLYTPVNEDFGLIPLEAMSASKPCIARNEGGPRETIADGTDGFLTGTPEQMAECMELLAKDPERCASMGKKGRSKVERDFTWEKFLKRFRQKTEEIVASTTSKTSQR